MWRAEEREVGPQRPVVTVDGEVQEVGVLLDEVRALEHGEHAPVAGHERGAVQRSPRPDRSAARDRGAVGELHVGERAGELQEDVDHVVVEAAAVLQAVVGHHQVIRRQQREIDAQHVGQEHLADQVLVGVAEVVRNRQRRAVGRRGEAQGREEAGPAGDGVVGPIGIGRGQRVRQDPAEPGAILGRHAAVEDVLRRVVLVDEHGLEDLLRHPLHLDVGTGVARLPVRGEVAVPRAARRAPHADGGVVAEVRRRPLGVADDHRDRHLDDDSRGVEPAEAVHAAGAIARTVRPRSGPSGVDGRSRKTSWAPLTIRLNCPMSTTKGSATRPAHARMPPLESTWLEQPDTTGLCLIGSR